MTVEGPVFIRGVMRKTSYELEPAGNSQLVVPGLYAVQRDRAGNEILEPVVVNVRTICKNGMRVDMVRPETAVETCKSDVLLRTCFDQVATAVGTRRSRTDALVLMGGYNRITNGKRPDKLFGFPPKLALDPQLVFEKD